MKLPHLTRQPINNKGSGSLSSNARFIDIAFFVAVLVLALFSVGVSYTWELSNEVKRDDISLREQREKDATLKEQLARAIANDRLNQSQELAPHALPEDRDMQFVGDHATLFWTYGGADKAKYTTYAVELRKLPSSTTSACDKNIDLLECDISPHLFAASDPINNSTRIPPPDSKSTLSAGRYFWRVAPMPVAGALRRSNLISDWSPFNSFTLYSGLDERVRATKTVRVGTNLEQNSNFSALDSQGRAVGLDISLVYAIVEGCLKYDTTDSRVTYVEQDCKQYVSRSIANIIEPRIANQHCDSTISGSTPGHYLPLCVTLVPIRAFGDWKTALRRQDIDLFIGSLTRAQAREIQGIRFSRGYFPFMSRIYVRKSEIGRVNSVAEWLTRKRVIGVIEASTNEQLLNKLKREFDGLRGTQVVDKAVFPSFPALENAMDKGEVDGIIIDDTFVNNTRWVALEGLHVTAAWTSYANTYIGASNETLAIATIVEDVDSRRATELLSAINQSLDRRSPLVTSLIPHLHKVFWEGSHGSATAASK